jgi:hypothetical protein
MERQEREKEKFPREKWIERQGEGLQKNNRTERRRSRRWAGGEEFKMMNR